jgi:hypothetical protein
MLMACAATAVQVCSAAASGDRLSGVGVHALNSPDRARIVDLPARAG